MEEKKKNNHIVLKILLILIVFAGGIVLGVYLDSETELFNKIEKKDTKEKNITKEKQKEAPLEVTDTVKTRLKKFITAATQYRASGSTRENFINGTTSLTKDIKLKMTNAAIYNDNKPTKNIVLSGEEINNLEGVKPDANEIVDIIKISDYNDTYKELFNEEPVYEINELQMNGCPAPMAINRAQGTMYLFHRCGGTTATSYEEKINSYDLDNDNYYVHQELSQTTPDGINTTTKLLWKFDKNLKFISTTVE